MCDTSGCYESQPFGIHMSEKWFTPIWYGRLDSRKWQIKCQYSKVAVLSKKNFFLKFNIQIQNTIPDTFYVGGVIVICIRLSINCNFWNFDKTTTLYYWHFICHLHLSKRPIQIGVIHLTDICMTKGWLS